MEIHWIQYLVFVLFLSAGKKAWKGISDKHNYQELIICRVK